jgi:hypothetical protein
MTAPEVLSTVGRLLLALNLPLPLVLDLLLMLDFMLPLLLPLSLPLPLMPLPLMPLLPLILPLTLGFPLEIAFSGDEIDFFCWLICLSLFLNLDFIVVSCSSGNDHKRFTSVITHSLISGCNSLAILR